MTWQSKQGRSRCAGGSQGGVWEVWWWWCCGGDLVVNIGVGWEGKVMMAVLVCDIGSRVGV